MIEEVDEKTMKLIKKPSELNAKSPISCLIYGQPGVGKTTLALSAPKPLLIDLDRGLHRVARKFHSDSLQVNNFDEIIEVLSSSAINEYESIVIDTLGKLVDQISDWACKKSPNLKQYDGTLSLKGWGVVKAKFSEFLRDMMRLEKHLIFVAHEKEEKDDDIIKKRPDVCGSAGKDIVKELDLMGYMCIRKKKRVISFTPDDNYYAKNCFDLEPIIEIPADSNNFVGDKLLSKIEEKRIRDEEVAMDYEFLIRKQQEEIEEANTVDKVNEAYARLLQEQKLWDSELCWKRRLQNKCKEIGAIYDKELRLFIAQTKLPNGYIRESSVCE